MFAIPEDLSRSHKKKKKDRDRDKERSRNKERSHSKHRSAHSSSKSSSSSSKHVSSKVNGNSETVDGPVSEQVLSSVLPTPSPSPARDGSVAADATDSTENPVQFESASQVNSTIPPVDQILQNGGGSGDDAALPALSLPKSERKAFVQSNNVAPIAPLEDERKPTEGAGIVIKKDYLPSPVKKIKVEKTRDDVARVLNYDAEGNESVRSISNVITSEADELKPKAVPKIKLEPIDEPVVRTILAESASIDSISENKENSIAAGAEIEHIPPKDKSDLLSNNVKPESKKAEPSKDRKSGSHQHHHGSNGGKSSSSKSSSQRNSGTGSSRDCSRCVRRSKIKRSNVGVQCRRFGEPFKPVTPSATPLKIGRMLSCNMTDSLYSDLKYGRFFHVEVHTNGGASVVHLYQHEIDALNEAEMEELTEEFFRVVFSEDENGFAHHVMGIVHDAAAYMPDLLEHMADNYSTLTVKAGVLGRNSDIETSTLAQYYEQVEKHYLQGTFRYGPLHQISLVGKVHEEVGGYFPDLLGRLEQSPFLQKVSIEGGVFVAHKTSSDVSSFICRRCRGRRCQLSRWIRGSPTTGRSSGCGPASSWCPPPSSPRHR